MPAKKAASSKTVSRRSYAVAKKPTVYRQPRKYVSGRGAYYVQGHIGGRAKIPGFGSAEARLAGGYTNAPSFKGLGAYSVDKIRRNIFLHADPPSMRNSRYKEGAVIIRHREYIGDIISSPTASAFSISTYPLNPAQSATFPWLSIIAGNFEEYMINGMIFEFKSTASDAIASSTNLALGNVIMATSYDPLNPPFNSQMEMLNYEYAQSCKVSDSAMHMIECDPRQSPLTHLYTRTGPVPGNADLRLYDFGSFSIATSGLQGSSVNIGQLWVTYEFCFYKAKVSSESESAANMFKVAKSSPGDAWVTDLASYTADVNNSLEINLTNVVVSYSKGGKISFPVRSASTTYSIRLNYANLPSGTFTAPSVLWSNCYVIKGFQGNTSYLSVAPQSSLTCTNVSLQLYVTVESSQTASIIIYNGTIPGAGASGNVDILINEVAYLDPANYSYAP